MNIRKFIREYLNIPKNFKSFYMICLIIGGIAILELFVYIRYSPKIPSEGKVFLYVYSTILITITFLTIKRYMKRF